MDWGLVLALHTEVEGDRIHETGLVQSIVQGEIRYSRFSGRSRPVRPVARASLQSPSEALVADCLVGFCGGEINRQTQGGGKMLVW